MMLAGDCFLQYTTLRGHRDVEDDATTLCYVVFALALLFSGFVCPGFLPRTGPQDSKNTSVSLSTGLVAKILAVLSSSLLSTSFSKIAFVGFWVSFIMLLPPVMAVRCLTCKDNIAPGHDTIDCPLATEVAANAGALVAAATTVISVTKLLPVKFLRVLPRAVLDAIKALVHKPAGAFDYSGKTIKEVFEAAIQGYTSVEEAQIWLQNKLLDASTNIDVTKIKGTLDAVKSIGEVRQSNVKINTGAHTYLWALTHRCVMEGDVALMHSSLDDEGKVVNSYSIKQVRPTTMTGMMRRLNIWVMLVHATAVDNSLVVTAFLDDVVFGPMNKGLDWKVIHELFLVYLRYVEEDDALNLGNIYSSGGQDTKLKEAEENARVNFRFQRGEPASEKMPWNCAYDPKATAMCTSYNLKKDHPTTSIVNGKCKYKHACDKFILGDDGKRTQCGATDHCRANCTNPKKVDG